MSIKLTDAQLVILSAATQREDRCLVAPKNLRGGAAQKVAAKLLAAGLVKEIKAKPEMAIWRRDDEAGQSFSLRLTAAGLKAIAVDDNAGAPTSSNEQASQAIEPTRAERETDVVATLAMPIPAGTAPREGSKMARVLGLLANAPAVEEGKSEKAEDAANLPTTARAAEAMTAAASAPREGTKIARVIEMLRRERGAELHELIAATGWLPHTARAALTGLRHRGYDVRLERGGAGRSSVYRIADTLARKR